MTSTSSIQSDLSDRVRKGAALLDRAWPGWWDEFATDRLAMASCDRCILGQLYGSFAVGFLKIMLFQEPWTGPFSAEDHGFALSDQERECGDADDRFAALADAWWDEILRR